MDLKQTMASRPGAAPGELGFGDPVAQAGARPVDCGQWKMECQSYAGKRAGSGFALPARVISTKNKHLLVIWRCQPADSRRMFRCLRAHLLRSPENVKVSGTIAPRGHSPTVGSNHFLASLLNWRLATSFFGCPVRPVRVVWWMVVRFHFRSVLAEKQKPCLHGTSRVEKFLAIRLSLYLPAIRSSRCQLLGAIIPRRADEPMANIPPTPDCGRMVARATVASRIVADMLVQVFIERVRRIS